MYDFSLLVTTASDLAPQKVKDSPQGPEADKEFIGIKENLGGFIPLDRWLTDDQGRKYQLKEFLTNLSYFLSSITGVPESVVLYWQVSHVFWKASIQLPLALISTSLL